MSAPHRAATAGRLRLARHRTQRRLGLARRRLVLQHGLALVFLFLLLATETLRRCAVGPKLAGHIRPADDGEDRHLDLSPGLVLVAVSVELEHRAGVSGILLQL